MLGKLNKNLKYSQKTLLNLLAYLVLLIILLFFFVLPYARGVEEARGLLFEHRREFETKLIKEEKLSKISKNLSKIESDLDELDSALIDKNKKLEFITKLEGLAEKNNLDIKININFDKIESKNQGTPTNLSLSGTYQNLMQILFELENADFYLNIEELSLSGSRNTSRAPSSDSLPNNKLNMQISALSYWN